MNDLKLTVDSVVVRNHMTEMLKLIDDYNSLIYDLYNELYNISNNEVWVGKGADKFILSLAKDKESCMRLGKMLYKYANNLNDFTSEIENSVERCEFNG